MNRAPQIAVIGKGTPDDALAPLAHEVGELLAKAGAVIVCGGLGGVMEAAARGASAVQGTVIGIVPSSSSEQANRYCPTSGLLIDTVPAEMFDLGLTRDDMRHLERSPIRASCGAATSRIFASRTATTRCATCAHGWKT